MTSEVAICNQALARVGVDRQIESLSDNSSVARACAQWYEHCRDMCLADGPWPFALRVKALAQVEGTPPPGWNFEFAYPADCLAVKELMDEGGSRFPLRVWFASLYQSYNNTQYFNHYPRYPFEVRAGESQTVIVTDLEDPFALYVQRITDPNRFDIMFRDALAWALAKEVGMTLRADVNKVQMAEQMFMRANNAALSKVLREARHDREPDSVSISGRI